MTAPSAHWAVLPAARLPADAPAPGTHRTQLGGSVVVWSGSSDGAARVGRLGVLAAPAGRLALVTQVGRAFQDDHPVVPVLLDVGRHLVVDGAALPATAQTSCWRVQPLPADETVVDRPVLAPGRADPAVAALLGQLSPAALWSDLTWLAGLGTRHSLSPGFTQAATWAAARLTALGHAVSRSPISVGGGQSENVVADVAGTGAGPRALVLVTAHLDSVNTAGGPSAPAPGADDNASGAAGLLELARVLQTRRWRHDLRVVLFGGEEQGLHGSRQYVAALPPAERARVRAVLNLDMIGTRNTVQPAVLLEGAVLSSGLIGDLATAAATWTGLRVETSLSPFASDHVSFLDAGIPAVLGIEGSDSANGNVHTGQDVPAHVELALVQQVLRMGLAALAGWLEPVSVVPRQAGPVVSRRPDRLDVFAVGVDGSLQHRAWDGSTWQPSLPGHLDLGRP